MKVVGVSYSVQISNYVTLGINGQFVRFVRKQCKVSQDQFARMAGISPVTLRQFENGRTAPNFETILKITKTLKEINENLMKEVTA